MSNGGNPRRVIPERARGADRSRVALGRHGEDLAARYLQSVGMQILDRNWRCRLGELDIVALDVDAIVACEVKTRTDSRFGGPFAAVPGPKLRRIRQLVGQWLACHDYKAGRIRIDAIGIIRPTRGAAELTHLRGV